MTNVTTAERFAAVVQCRAVYLIFGDIEGKLDVLRVECTKCARKGRYQVHKLIAKYGRTRICNGLGIMRACLETQKLEQLEARMDEIAGRVARDRTTAARERSSHP